ncbi:MULTISPECIES: DNA cytosine methyltransferase [Lactococcus]|uniref:DNA cytosine methyltransferase n=1 Tax=Lactococcus TaxID=1357 RepID=UPI001F0E86FD|nr:MULTISPECIES: DNA cytosine methyltransferase [Lactococcus]MBS5601509.1 DNA cytosine methyltransferase [Lactococcus lactis]MCH5429797.1 DNA cytosine methyltransferase [Lactococcus lactis]MCT1181459.1 DNA (cytosine-5-)-methyltransferase [Lactococcus lactis]MCT4405747.1 DNA (cytosine-5-)-methyltransferase [Lactococcus cremoris]MDM7498853.1 DNA cytosine methyltransferase [Lactococcus lactis]
MLKIVEAFSGIGAQREALIKANIKYEILNTIEWDINAIYAYDQMHHTDNKPSEYSKEAILQKISKYTLSPDGKKPFGSRGLKHLSEKKLQLLYAAIDRNHNLCDITKVHGEDLPDDIDVLTYSFPCQDLSIAKNFQNLDSPGIDKGAGTRSGLLWEIERILKEKEKNSHSLPKFLLMENVNAINSPRHHPNFKLWRDELTEMGYVNKVYKGLQANDFGVPQARSRTFMLSVHSDKLSELEIDDLKFKREANLSDYLRLGKYPGEAKIATPNFTPSRQKIYNDNKHLVENGEIISEFTNTISTKQDRNPNAGVIIENHKMRYLTPRECFLLMGFPEEKFEKLQKANNTDHFFKDVHAWKMAGNSIVVDVLVEIFKEIYRIKQEYF